MLRQKDEAEGLIRGRIRPKEAHEEENQGRGTAGCETPQGRRGERKSAPRRSLRGAAGGVPVTPKPTIRRLGPNWRRR